MEQLEVIQSKIYDIRGQKVMLDRDLAEMYGVETRALNQAVKRNTDRFPVDFMFQLTDEETELEITNCDVQFYKDGRSPESLCVYRIRRSNA